MSRLTLALFLGAMGVFTPLSWADNFTLNNVYIERITQHEDRYAGCMVKLSGGNPKDLDGDCGDNWLSLDCSGLSRSKSVGAQFLSTSQLAWIQQQKVHAHFTDDAIFNGYCTLIRMDLLD